MTSTEVVLKHRPGDFLVRESVVVELADAKTATHQYALLRKCGYTTMEAVRLVADGLGLAARDVTYCGLKDEDGITEQLVAFTAGLLPAAGNSGNGSSWHREGTDRWLELLHYGYGTAPLEIGRLAGNGFRVVLRDLAEATAADLAAARKVSLLFLNYYDTQRFGVPGGPKRTHFLGAAILAGQWDSALRMLVELNVPESRLAADWRGTACDFFADLDPRITSFYLAAHASAQWNADLAELVCRSCQDSCVEIVLDGLSYQYAGSDDAAAKVLLAARDLPYTKYSFSAGAASSRLSHRPTVVQTTVEIEPSVPDEYFADRFAVTLGFGLPSGSYATAAIRQLAHHVIKAG